MAQHQLSLNIPDIMNECIIKIDDTSYIDPLVPVDCLKLQVTPPGFNTQTEFTNLNPGFHSILNACDLGLQTVDCGVTFSSIPDGIYIIKISVSPNTVVYAEYNHLRITKALIKYHKILCSIIPPGCEPTVEVKKKITQLQYIRTLLDAAKGLVEYCHEPVEGMAVYTYALKLLNKFTCTTC